MRKGLVVTVDNSVVQVGFRAFGRGQLILDLSQPGEIGLVILFGERAFSSPKLAM
jgi:hypothetical protein